MLRLTQVAGGHIRGCRAPSAADPLLLLEGDRTEKIVLQENDFSQAIKAVGFGPGASAKALSSN